MGGDQLHALPHCLHPATAAIQFVETPFLELKHNHWVTTTCVLSSNSNMVYSSLGTIETHWHFLPAPALSSPAHAATLAFLFGVLRFKDLSSSTKVPLPSIYKDNTFWIGSETCNFIELFFGACYGCSCILYKGIGRISQVVICMSQGVAKSMQRQFNGTGDSQRVWMASLSVQVRVLLLGPGPAPVLRDSKTKGTWGCSHPSRCARRILSCRWSRP